MRTNNILKNRMIAFVIATSAVQMKYNWRSSAQLYAEHID
jgi:hypothetical protein